MSFFKENLAVNRLLFFVTAFRRFVLEIAIGFVLLTLLIYWYSPDLLTLLQIHLDQKLAFFGVFEPVIALIKLSSVVALILMAPWIMVRIGNVLSSAFGLRRIFIVLFVFFGLLLFYAGATFCFLVTLPFGVKFLLGYQSEVVKPVISVGKFVDFTGLFLLSFGLIFELPLIMTLVCRLGVCTPDTFSSKRRYAILIIAILAAALTPTPDVFNMSLMALPLYFLYEIGIVVARLVCKRPQEQPSSA